MNCLEQLREDALRAFIPVMRPRTAELLARETAKLKPDRTLEIGTCIGLGVITVLLNGGRHVTSIELDEERFSVARKNIESFDFSSRCELFLGDCKEILPFMKDNRYDLIILDGPKSFYLESYPYLREMVLPGGKIFIDDIYFHGLIKKEGMPERKHRTNVLALREFLKTVRSDSKFECREYDMEDGVMILLARGE